tara:strand:+ start:131 stop:364 length:234 start_codon:yes stop_codon:yes gene_type:complete
MLNPFTYIYGGIKYLFNFENEEKRAYELREIVIKEQPTISKPYDPPEKCLKSKEVKETYDFYNNIYSEFDIVNSVDA